MRRMNYGWVAALACLVSAACAGSPGVGAFGAPARSVTIAKGGGEIVVVANVGGDFTKSGLFEFGLTGTTPQTQIPNGVATYLFAGLGGDLYTIACCYNERSVVAEYGAGATKPSRLLTGTGATSGGVVDSRANVYLVDRSQQGILRVYSPQNTAPSKTVKVGIYKPIQIARDASNDHLFVLNGGRGFVSEFAAGASSIVRKIATPGAYAIAVDSNRALLYVAFAKSIEVYKRGATAPYRNIVFGKNTLAVYGLAVDSQGRLYAATALCCGPVAITAFALGASTPAWRKVLPSSVAYSGHCGGEPFAFDDLSNIFVIDCQDGLHYAGVVLEYSAAGSLLRTLAGKVTAAYAVATVP